MKNEEMLGRMGTQEKAFPIYVDADKNGVANLGMTLRDYFAGQALSAMSGMTMNGFSTYERMDNKSVAIEAYKVADAMLEARE